MAQPAGLGSSPLLQLGVAEAGLLTLLGIDHILLLKRKTGAVGQGQEGGQIHGLGKLAAQLRLLAGMGEKGIELLEAQGRGSNDLLSSGLGHPSGRVRFSPPPLQRRPAAPA